MRRAKGIILLILGIVLMPLGFWIGWRIEYSGPMGFPTYPYMVPGIAMFILGCILIPTGIYYLIKGIEE